MPVGRLGVLVGPEQGRPPGPREEPADDDGLGEVAGIARQGEHGALERSLLAVVVEGPARQGGGVDARLVHGLRDREHAEATD